VDNGTVFTPDITAKYMVDRLGEVVGKRILEPGVGKGIFVRELLSRGVDPAKITAVDINPDFEPIYRDLGINYHISDFLLEENPPEDSRLFDCVIGNPPYLSRHSTYIRAHREALLKRFLEIGVYDAYSLFIYHGLRFLKPGGTLCFIVSDSFLAIKYHHRLRRYLLENCRLREIVLAPRRLFSSQGVNNSPCIIVVDKIQPRVAHKFVFVDRLSSEQEYYKPARVRHPRQKYLLEAIDDCPISPHVDRFVANLFSSLPSINEVMEGHIGMHTHDNHRFIAAVEGARLAEAFRRQGRTVIPHKYLNGKGRWHPYLKKGGEERYYRQAEEAIDWSPQAVAHYDIPAKGNLFLKEGIIISGVSRRLAARYMPPGCLWDSNKAIGFVAVNPDVSLWYLLGLLNSRLYSFLLKGILNTTNCLQISDIRRLPFKYPSQEQKSEVEDLARRIVDGLKKDPGYDHSSEQMRLDEAVFGLYAVPEELKDFIKGSF